MKQGEEGVPVAEICLKTGISQGKYFNWKQKYAGPVPSEMKRLRQLEEENARRKRIVADPISDRQTTFPRVRSRNVSITLRDTCHGNVK